MTNRLRHIGLKRRFLFVVILLAAALMASTLVVRFTAPAQKYDYLNDAVEVREEIQSVTWTGMDIRNADLLSKRDKEEFSSLLKISDGHKTNSAKRPLLIGQANASKTTMHCESTSEVCTASVFLNRTLSPTYIHGDLRLVSLQETSLRQDLKVNQNTGKITVESTYRQARQFRFVLTQRGWVMKTNELVSEDVIIPPERPEISFERYSGLNYYPASAPWSKFWSEYPREEVRSDLNLINDLGANSVRIFLNHDYFTNPATKDMAHKRLADFMDLCAENNIKAIVTLFDLRSDYRFANWSSDSLHIGEVIETIGNHKSLLAIDLKNQADLDFDSQGEPLVLSWLEAMTLSVREHSPRVAVTIGWSDAKQASNLSELLDLVSYHDYNKPDGFSARFKSVQAAIGIKPIFVTEIGSSRWSLLKFGEGSPKAQATRLQKQLDQLTGASGVFVWTLHDFEDVPTNIVGHRPWRRNQQKIFGIIDPAGNPLPSGEIFQTFNATFLSTPYSSMETSQ